MTNRELAERIADAILETKTPDGRKVRAKGLRPIVKWGEPDAIGIEGVLLDGGIADRIERILNNSRPSAKGTK